MSCSWKSKVSFSSCDFSLFSIFLLLFRLKYTFFLLKVILFTSNKIPPLNDTVTSINNWNQPVEFVSSVFSTFSFYFYFLHFSSIVLSYLYHSSMSLSTLSLSTRLIVDCWKTKKREKKRISLSASVGASFNRRTLHCSVDIERQQSLFAVFS